MDHLSAADIDTYMSAVTYQVSRERAADCFSAAALCLRSTCDADTCNSVAVLCQSGTIKRRTRSASAINIRDTQLAVCCIHDCLCNRGIAAACITRTAACAASRACEKRPV